MDDFLISKEDPNLYPKLTECYANGQTTTGGQSGDRKI